MEKSFRAWVPEQGWLFPPSVLDLVPEGHAAHVVREIVRQELDLSAVYASYVEGRGGPPYHPAMMTAVLLYGYTQGIRSSRRLARACEERVDFMAVTGMQRPDHDTVNEFRRRHAAALEGLFAQVVRLCAEAGLVSLGHVSLDGTKIKANASKHKAMSYDRMKKSEEELRAQIRKYFEESAANDEAEDAEFGKGRRGDEQPEWVKNKKERLARIRAARIALEKEAAEKARAEAAKQAERPPCAPGRKPAPPSPTPGGSAQRNFTDPESRVMRARLRRGGHRSRYRLRKVTVEPVFGQIKECRGLRQFLLRGLAKVRTEWSLACSAHNLLKLLGARLACP